MKRQRVNNFKPHPLAKKMEARILNVAMIGSGIVNFGGYETPWNHSKRLEELGGVNIVAIVDPLTEKAKEVLSAKLAGSHSHLYGDCKVYADVESALKEKKIHVAFIGRTAAPLPAVIYICKLTLFRCAAILSRYICRRKRFGA